MPDATGLELIARELRNRDEQSVLDTVYFRDQAAVLVAPAAVPATLDTVFKQSPASPLVPRSVLLAANALTQNNDPNGALELLRKYYSVISQPKGDLAMAAAGIGLMKRPRSWCGRPGARRATRRCIPARSRKG